MSFRDLLLSRKELELEFERVNAEEAAIDADLREYFHNLSSTQPKSLSNKRIAFDSIDLTNNFKKLESSSTILEVITQDSSKLVHQIDECRQLSERLNVMVRRLDLMQMRAQQALACTEDLINLKECKIRLQTAIEERNLQHAVHCIRQYHTIDSEAAKNSDDYEAIVKAEQETRDLVRDTLNKAMETSDISAIVAICPLLQTLGLEVEARDKFMSFIESSVFIAVSADAGVDENVTDAVTGYAQALSNVFNSTYLIFQKYLTLVIQGMENSLGDVLFIRKLHLKCEKEAGLVLKRYMKYRNIKQVISIMQSGQINSSSSTTSLVTAGNTTMKLTTSDIHMILDELTLLIQYCSLYAKYLKNLCAGAESRKRSLSNTSTDITAILSSNLTPSSSGVGSHSLSTSLKVIVFHGPTEFDKMIDELLNLYYMEGEHYLLKSVTKTCLPKNIDERHDMTGLDESFFVLQRCGLRAIATNNIHAACAILHLIADLLTSDIAIQAKDYLMKAVNRIGVIFNDHMSKHIKLSTAQGTETGSLSMGLKSAMSLASTITGSTTTSNVNNDDHGDMNDEDDEDPYKIAQYVEAFNILERCIRYTERLTKDIMSSAETVFDSTKSSTSATTSNGLKSLPASSRPQAHDGMNVSNEMDKIKLCKEDFDGSRVMFQQVLRQGLERLVSYADNAMKDTLVSVLGKNGPMGGVRFDLSDDKFDDQLAVSLLPKSITVPFETIINIMTFGLSDTNKDSITTLLAEACVERIESFINQTTFRFAGALKFEECVRSITNIFTRISTAAIRNRFARLREIMIVLTSDLNDSHNNPSYASDNFSHLTMNEVEAYLALRVDNPNQDMENRRK